MNQRLAELIERARDGDVSMEEQRELSALLESPELRAAAVAQWRSGLLGAALSGRTAEEISSLVRLAATNHISRVHRRVRNQVAHRRRRRSQWQIVGGLIAAALLLTIGLVAMMHPHRSAPVTIATITNADAGVTIEAGGAVLTARIGDRLHGDDRLRTNSGRCELRYEGEETIIALAPQTDLKLARMEARKLIILKNGSITAVVEHQPAGAGLRVTTDLAVAEVVGTRFSLSADDHRSRLEVDEGRVRFSRRDDATSVDVDANSYAVAEAGVPLVARSREVVRMIDDHEGALAWSQRPECAVLELSLVNQPVHDGHGALRLAYRPKSDDPEPYGEVMHPLGVRPGDRVLRFFVRVSEMESGANWNVQFRQRDTSCWMIGSGSCSALHSGWNQIDLPLPQNPKLVSDPTGHYDPAAVEGLLFSLCTSRAVLYIDDVALISSPDGSVQPP